MIAAMMVASLAFVSCETKEVYDFEFDMPGSVVTEFEKTIEIPFTRIQPMIVL